LIEEKKFSGDICGRKLNDIDHNKNKDIESNFEIKSNLEIILK